MRLNSVNMTIDVPTEWRADDDGELFVTNCTITLLAPLTLSAPRRRMWIANNHFRAYGDAHVSIEGRVLATDPNPSEVVDVGGSNIFDTVGGAPPVKTENSDGAPSL